MPAAATCCTAASRTASATAHVRPDTIPAQADPATPATPTPTTYRIPARRRLPRHPRTVILREDHLLEVIRQFFAQRIFGPDRAALLAATLPASDDTAAARRQDEAGALRTRLTRIDAAENAHALIATPSLCWATILTEAPGLPAAAALPGLRPPAPICDSGKHQVSIHAVLSPATPPPRHPHRHRQRQRCPPPNRWLGKFGVAGTTPNFPSHSSAW